MLHNCIISNDADLTFIYLKINCNVNGLDHTEVDWFLILLEDTGFIALEKNQEVLCTKNK